MVLLRLTRAEFTAGVAGLRLFIACVGLGTAMLAAVWCAGAALSGAFERNGRAILGGDAELSVSGSPLPPADVARLAETGALSLVVDMRSSVRANGRVAPVELRAVDAAYPLYGSLRTDGAPLPDALARVDGRYGALVEPSLLTRLGIGVGDSLQVGSAEFIVRGVITSEPDRLSAGTFMVGPRLMIATEALPEAELLGFGALVDYRYRIRLDEGATTTDIRLAANQIDRARGADLRTYAQAAGRVQRIVDRTTTFLGITGVVALAIALAGAWAAANAWVRKRARTIALYRLSGAGPGLVASQHLLILGVAALAGIALGVAAASIVVIWGASQVASLLPVPLGADILVPPALQAAATMFLGTAGAALPATAGAAQIPAGAAMRAGEAAPAARIWQIALGGVLIAAAAAIAVLRLPAENVAMRAAMWLAGAVLVLAVGGLLLATLLRLARPSGFVLGAAVRSLGDARSVAAKALAIGIGIAGITAVESVRVSLDAALRAELPDDIPALVLLDVQPAQIGAVRAAAAETAGVESLDARPSLRGVITEVNGRPAGLAIAHPRGGRMLRGDISLSWTDEPVGGGLMAGSWWPADHAGPPLLSIDEDVAEAFGIGPGDRMTVTISGRAIEAEVANVREEIDGPLAFDVPIVASPEPMRHAPQSWIGLVDAGEQGADAYMERLAEETPNVTVVDVRRVLEQITQAVTGAALGVYAIAGILLVTGGLALAAVVAADADARAREALAFALVGASRAEIARARLAEVAAVGVVAAVLGGGAGLIGGWWLTDAAMRIEWVPGWSAVVLPIALGVLVSVSAGLAAGLGAVPRGRGEIARRLAG